MYSNKLAVAVKAGGKVLREVGDTTYLPFGSEYSIQLKNLNTTRAAVRVWIDGVDVLHGNAALINPNSSFELERFIKGGTLQAGNRFKFIERTAAVEAHRGIRADDGLIRVEFQFEQAAPAYVAPTTTTIWASSGSPTYYPTSGSGIQGSLGPHGADGYPTTAAYNSAAYNPNSVLRSKTASSPTLGSSETVSAAAGITAPGSISNQAFSVVATPVLEAQQHVIVLRLAGAVEEQQGQYYVTQPLTVRTKTACVMCGSKSGSNARFCSQCGASLQYVK